MRAKKQNIRVIVLAGTVGHDADVNYRHGIDAFVSIMQCQSTLENAINDAERLLVEAAEGAMRMVTIGRFLRRDEKRLGDITAKLFGKALGNKPLISVTGLENLNDK